MSFELRISSSPFFKFLVYEDRIDEDAGRPFSYPAWSIPYFYWSTFTFSADGAIVDAWPYSSGLKVWKICIYSYFLTIGGVGYNSFNSTIIPELFALDWNSCRFLLLVFVDSVREQLICRVTADQACFCTSHLCLWVFTNRMWNFFFLKHF